MPSSIIHGNWRRKRTENKKFALSKRASCIVDADPQKRLKKRKVVDGLLLAFRIKS